MTASEALAAARGGPPDSIPQGDPARAAAYFDEAVAGFGRACLAALGGVIEHRYRIAGALVRVRFAGSALPPLLSPALAHLRLADGPLDHEHGHEHEPEHQPEPEHQHGPDTEARRPRQAIVPGLTILAWDEASTGVQLPPAPWSVQFARSRGDIVGWDTSDHRIALAEGCTLLYRPAGAIAVLVAPAPAAVSYHQRAAPFRAIFGWWAAARGVELVHAGVVGRPGGGVLLAGKGGSGKSTAALACLLGGLGYAGDDFCLVDLATDPPRAHSLYGSAKLVPGGRLAPADLGLEPANPDRLGPEKALVFLRPRFEARMLRSMPVRAIVLPRPSGREDSRLVPSAPGRALLALATSIFLLPGTDDRTLRRLADLARRLPCHVLESGTDLAGIVAALAPLLADPSRGGQPAQEAS